MISSFFKNSGIFNYLLSLGLLAVAVFSQGDTKGVPALIDPQKSVALVVLSLCMLAVDWSVKQRYWASKASYHLLLFPLFILGFPLEIWDNWILIYYFFLWIAFNFLVAIDQSGQITAKVFNAFFFFFLGVLFFPQGVIILPLLWAILMIKGALNFQNLLLSIIPVFALLLFEVSVVYFLPNSFLIPSVDFSTFVFSLPLKEVFHQNLWWGIMLLLLLMSFFKHYFDMGSKGASYGSGMIALFVTVVVSMFFGLFFQSQSSFAWVFFLMGLMALSTRLFEGIKRLWLRELFFSIIILLLLYGKYGFPFLS